jgi:hypothetical protein
MIPAVLTRRTFANARSFSSHICRREAAELDGAMMPNHPRRDRGLPGLGTPDRLTGEFHSTKVEIPCWRHAKVLMAARAQCGVRDA